MEIPSGLEHIKLIGKGGEHNRLLTAPKLDSYKDDLKLFGVSLSVLYQAATCHRKCFGGPHVLESLSGRVYNLACSAYILMCRGMYDESLNLVRSIGEISNLIAMSVVDKEALKKWLASDKKTRIREFSPAKIRKILEQHESFFMYADKDWYSKFCEDFTHVNPETKPNAHNNEGLPHIGGFVQDEGLEYVLNELTNLCAQIAMLVSKYADLDDMFEELVSALNISPENAANKQSNADA